MSGTGGSQRHCQSLKTHYLARDQVSLMRGMGNDLVVASFAAPPPPYVLLLLLGLAASSPNESGSRCASLVRARVRVLTHTSNPCQHLALDICNPRRMLSLSFNVKEEHPPREAPLTGAASAHRGCDLCAGGMNGETVSTCCSSSIQCSGHSANTLPFPFPFSFLPPRLLRCLPQRWKKRLRQFHGQ